MTAKEVSETRYTFPARRREIIIGWVLLVLTVLYCLFVQDTAKYNNHEIGGFHFALILLWVIPELTYALRLSIEKTNHQIAGWVAFFTLIFVYMRVHKELVALEGVSLTEWSILSGLIFSILFLTAYSSSAYSRPT